MNDFPIPDGACGHEPRRSQYGPSWPCTRTRWHGGRHRFRNYTWSRVPHAWRVKALWATWKTNQRLRGMGATGNGLLPYAAVLYPSRFEPLPVVPSHLDGEQQ